MDRVPVYNRDFSEVATRYLGHARENIYNSQIQRQLCAIYLQSPGFHDEHLVWHMRFAGIDPMELCSQGKGALAVIQEYLVRQSEWRDASHEDFISFH